MVTTLDAPEEPRIIQGRQAQSKEEWFVAKALWKLGHSFEYQLSYFGGRVRGGQILDFMVYTTVPLPTPIQVYGEYWHKGRLGSEDRMKQALLESELRGYANPLVILWGEDLSDEDEAYRKVRREVGPA